MNYVSEFDKGKNVYIPYYSPQNSYLVVNKTIYSSRLPIDLLDKYRKIKFLHNKLPPIAEWLETPRIIYLAGKLLVQGTVDVGVSQQEVFVFSRKIYYYLNNMELLYKLFKTPLHNV